MEINKTEEVGLPVYAFIKGYKGHLEYRYHKTQIDELKLKCPTKVLFEFIGWEETQMKLCIKQFLLNRPPVSSNGMCNHFQWAT